MNSLLIASPALLAQTLTGGVTGTGSAGVNWLYQFTNNLTLLTSQNSDALTGLGMTELSFIATMTLVFMVAKWNTDGMALSVNQKPVNLGDLMNFLVKLLICALLESYWTNPIPGASFGISRMPAYIAQVIVAHLDQNSLNTLTALLNTAGQGTHHPTAFAIPEWISYWIVEILMGVASAILFLVNCSSFLFYAVTALFGPVFIPLLMTDTFRGKFYHFLDALISFAMIRAVASAFVFVWAGFLNGFIQETFNGNYSIENWDANFIAVLAVFGAFILNLTFVPTITQAIFGGSAGSAGRIGQLAEALIIRKVL